MASMPIHAATRPTSIAGQPNGAVDPYLLAVVDRAGTIWMMAELPARGMRALHAALFEEFGVRLSTTGRGRTFQMQYDLFLLRHRPALKAEYDSIPAGEGRRRYWPQATTVFGLASQWWALKPRLAAAAVPGTSPHGWWCADDICLPGNISITARPDILEWLYGNAGQYGFAWSLLSEPWHLQWAAGDILPAAVVLYEDSITRPPRPPEQPEKPPITPLEDTMLKYRDKRFGNVFLINGGVTTTGPALAAAVPGDTVTDVHDQSLISYMRLSKLTMAEMAPTGEAADKPFNPPPDLR